MNTPERRRCLIALALAGTLLAMGPKFPKAEVQRIPGWSTDHEPDFGGLRPKLSASGRWIAFESKSTNLLETEGDFSNDIYLYDARKDLTLQVSRVEGGGDPSLSCTRPAIAGSGRFVAYDSADTQIVTPDVANTSEVFLFDRKKKITERISVSSEGEAVSGHSSAAAVSKSGRHVAFESTSTQLVPGDSNNKRDIFLRDRKKRTTTRLSLASDGGQADQDCVAPAISGNGRFVAFTTRAALVPEDTNGFEDVYVVDAKKHTIVRASVASDGSQGEQIKGATLPPRSGPDISISANGRYLAFRSDAMNLVAEANTGGADIFLRDLKKGSTILVSKNSEGEAGNSASVLPAISPEGRVVAFQSYATNLVPGDANGKQDVFVRDVKKGQTARVSLGPDAVEANDVSTLASVSARGKWVGFESEATNLLAGEDGNARKDVFLLRR